MNDQEISNWETCKENVQPLRHGRRITNLTAALQHGGTVEQILRSQRQAFETELRSYNGNDPLEVYLRYIEWTEQNFPSGGSSGHLRELVQNAVEQFNGDERYQSDQRFFEVWKRLMTTVTEPLEMFLYLYTKNSFTKLAAFYAEWATEYEKLGNMQKADEVYNKGLENCAEPVEILQKRHNEFQVRTMRRVMQAQSDTPQSMEDDRTVLGTLHTYGPRHTVPIERSRATITGQTQQPVWPQPSSANDRRSANNKKVTVFCDDSRPSALPPQIADRAKMPSRSDNTENEMKAGKWTEAKIKPTSKSVGVVGKPQFEIHEDAESVQGIVTPAKTGEVFHVLSTKKLDEKPTDGLRLLKDDANCKEKLMFNRQLVYAGTQEFSFEEIRALAYSLRSKSKVHLAAEQTRMYANIRLSSEVEGQLANSLHSSVLSAAVNANSMPAYVESSVFVPLSGQSTVASISQTSTTAMRQSLSRELIGNPNEKFMCPPEVCVLKGFAVSMEELRAARYEQRQEALTNDRQLATAVSRSASTLPSTVTDAAARKSLQFSTSVSEIATNDRSEASVPSSVSNLPVSSGMYGTSSARSSCSSLTDLTVKQNSTELSPALPMTLSTSAVSNCITSSHSQRWKQSPVDSGIGGTTPGGYYGYSTLSSRTTDGGAVLPNVQAHSAIGSTAYTENGSNGSAGSAVAISVGNSNVGLLSSSGCQVFESSQMKRVSSASSLLTNTSTHSSHCHRDTSGSADCTRDLLHANKSINVAQSVTMHTAEASNAVLAMFNKTLDICPKQPVSDNEASYSEHDAYDSGPARALPLAPASEFIIYEDDPHPPASTAVTHAPSPPFINALVPSTTPFAVFEDSPGPATLTERAPIVVFEDPEPLQVRPLPIAGGTQTRALGMDKENCARAVPSEPLPFPNDLEIEDVEMQFDDFVGANKPFDLDLADFNETFGAPNLESTRCYYPSQAASTPFCPAEPPPQSVWPVSNIKPVSAVSLTASASDAEDVKNKRRSSTYATKMYNLSPITERSEQYASSSGSSGESAATTRHLTTTMSSALFGKAVDKTPYNLHQHADSRQRMDSTSQSAQHFSHSSITRNLSGKDSLAHNGLGVNNALLVQNLLCTSELPAAAAHSMQTETSCSKGHHEIDVTTYVPLADAEPQLNASVWIDTHNPFDEELIAKFLRKLPQPITSYPTYRAVDGTVTLRANSKVSLAGKQYQVVRMLGQGANARAYLLQNTADNSQLVAKVQAPSCPWEFYITCELQTRLANSSFVNLSDAVMTVEQGVFFADSSILLNKFLPYGSLLDLSNAIKTAAPTASQAELLRVMLTVELMRIVEGIHKCHIIHGDFKPDNLLIRDIPRLENYSDNSQLVHNLPLMLKLIDWGQAIDLRCFPANTTFTAKVTTSGFQCIEMMTNRPWTYQADLFGLIGTIHVLFFNKYMQVFQQQGRWRITSTFARNLRSTPILSQLFDTMLNISSCDDIPSLQPFREQLEEFFIQRTVPDLLQEVLDRLRQSLGH